jgi:hypothetical protein
MSPALLVEKVIGKDPVRRWRSERLQQAGYSPVDALVLSRRTDVDLHVALGLIARGCPPETAVHILI